MNDEELIERIVALNYREFGANVGNDLKRIIIKKEDELDKYKNIVEEIQTELFDIKDMIYKPETREEDMPTQRKISEVIKKLEELKGE